MSFAFVAIYKACLKALRSFVPKVIVLVEFNFKSHSADELWISFYTRLLLFRWLVKFKESFEISFLLNFKGFGAGETLFSSWFPTILTLYLKIWKQGLTVSPQLHYKPPLLYIPIFFLHIFRKHKIGPDRSGWDYSIHSLGFTK